MDSQAGGEGDDESYFTYRIGDCGRLTVVQGGPTLGQSVASAQTQCVVRKAAKLLNDQSGDCARLKSFNAMLRCS